MNHWATIYRCLWGVAITLIVIVTISFFVPKFRQWRDGQKKRYDIQQENRQTAALIAELKRKQEQILSDPAFIKLTARGIGMVEAGEVVFKFTNSASRVSTNMPK